ncbi:hypothetical protein SAMN05444365_10398 [Micromonospora pattaloongensis]|uniref:Uncharacterized protein n=1 Tax=Micromonospora pattaloongensis TaxID=405436 RepID=A0A1H3LVH7_9ACTN|nr:hypothetical protein [Micromonospora pattaloongensis]SDY68034.1 hypothetical protein SAMN05444365_10398 [Micromonospora pattaloongensis]
MSGLRRTAARQPRRQWPYMSLVSYLGAAVALALGLAVWQTVPAAASDAYGMRACDRLGASTGWPPAGVAQSVWTVGRHAKTDTIREHAERLHAAAPTETPIAPPGWEQLLFDMIDACVAAGWQPPTPAPSTTTSTPTE